MSTKNQETEKPEKEELKTEVTTVAKEKEKGAKIETPSAGELVARASSMIIRDLQQLRTILPGLSKKEITRAVVGGIDLPTDGVPVKIQTNEGKMAFALIQRIISSRFIVMQHHINEELQNQKQKKENEKGETNDESTK